MSSCTYMHVNFPSVSSLLKVYERILSMFTFVWQRWDEDGADLLSSCVEELTQRGRKSISKAGLWEVIGSGRVYSFPRWLAAPRRPIQTCPAMNTHTLMPGVWTFLQRLSVWLAPVWPAWVRPCFLSSLHSWLAMCGELLATTLPIC